MVMCNLENNKKKDAKAVGKNGALSFDTCLLHSAPTAGGGALAPE